MHDTAHLGGVTSSALAASRTHVEDGADTGAETEADRRPDAHADGRPVAAAPRELLGERVAVRVQERHDREPDQQAGERTDRATDERPHLRPGVYDSAGDVDANGDVVNRLRRAIAAERPELVDEQLAAVRRLIAKQVAA
jgi:hypothetical protein